MIIFLVSLWVWGSKALLIIVQVDLGVVVVGFSVPLLVIRVLVVGVVVEGSLIIVQLILGIVVLGFSDFLHVIYVLVVVDISGTWGLFFRALLCVLRASFVLKFSRGWHN